MQLKLNAEAILTLLLAAFDTFMAFYTGSLFMAWLGGALFIQGIRGLKE